MYNKIVQKRSRKECLEIVDSTVRDFDEKTHQKKTLKTPKRWRFLPLIRSTYSKFHNESRANRTF